MQHLSELLAFWGSRKNVPNLLIIRDVILALPLQAQLTPLFGLENVYN